MEANLGHLAPMPIADVCTPASQTVYYAYKLWPQKLGEEKVLRGSKCPSLVDGSIGMLQDYSRQLPRTKIIIGIRHPVSGFV